MHQESGCASEDGPEWEAVSSHGLEPQDEVGPAVRADLRRFIMVVPTWLPGASLLVMLGFIRLGNSELWLDEAFTDAAVRHLGETLRATGATMGTYYVLLTPWSRLASSLAWLRAPSLLFMVLALVTSVSLVERTSGRRAAVWAGLVAGCLPIIVNYSAEARSYGLVCLLVATMWLALDRVLVGDRGPWGACFVVISALLPLTHGLGVVQVLMAGLAVLIARPPRGVLVLMGYAGLASASVLLAMTRIGISDVGGWIEPLSVSGALVFVRLIVHPSGLVAVVLLAAALVGAWTCVTGHRTDPSERFRRVMYLAWGPGSMAVILLISVLRASQVPRYGMAAAFALAALMGIAVDRIEGGLAAQAVPLALVAVVTFGQLNPGTEQWWTNTARLLAAEQVLGDQVVFGGADVRMPFESAWTRQRTHGEPSVLGPGDPLGSFDRFDAEPDVDVILAEVDRSERVWVVEDDQKWDGVLDQIRRSLLAEGYRNVDRWDMGDGILVWLLGPPRG